jgi:hypothetical protein
MFVNRIAGDEVIFRKIAVVQQFIEFFVTEGEVEIKWEI